MSSDIRCEVGPVDLITDLVIGSSSLKVELRSGYDIIAQGANFGGGAAYLLLEYLVS